jgi:hypothetical protein
LIEALTEGLVGVTEDNEDSDTFDDKLLSTGVNFAGYRRNAFPVSSSESSSKLNETGNGGLNAVEGLVSSGFVNEETGGVL